MDLLTRRSAVRGAGLTALAGVAGFFLARRSDAAKEPAPGERTNAYGDPPAEVTAPPLANVDQVPAGGGLVLEERRVVLTRDEGGTLRAFSATCTHQGCSVESVRNGRIVCPCHGSAFDARTGEPVAGPARSPLREIAVEVRGNEVFRA